MTPLLRQAVGLLNKGIASTPKSSFSTACGSQDSFLKGARKPIYVSQVSHNATPRLPLLYYKATNRAMESMNHRVFYANWIFVFAAFDILTSYVDF